MGDGMKFLQRYQKGMGTGCLMSGLPKLHGGGFPSETLYDMFQHWGEQQCQQDPSAKCEGQAYEAYQRERDGSVKQE